MAKGIVGKVWNIQGESINKNTASNLKDSIGYILNGEKINGKLEMDLAEQLGRECKYVSNDIKTVSGAYVGGRNLVSTEIREAVKEMMEVKKFYEKPDGRAALHGIISLDAEESDVNNASRLMQLCDAVMKEVFPNHQVIYGVHTNTENLHIHFIVNSVGLDGKKIYQDKYFIKKVFHPCINKYAREYGFTPNPKWEKEYQDYLATKKSLPEIKIMVRDAIDCAIEKSNDFNEFIENMKKTGYDVNVGKYISVNNNEMEKAIRTHQLGANYTKDSIVERISIRKQAFTHLKLGSYVMQEEIKDVFVPTNEKMPKYKDMSEKQKEYVIRQLRMGKNPWREHQQRSWQLNNIADQLNLQNRVIKYMEFYSTDGTLEGTLAGMLDAKKKISMEKKSVKEQMARYKPVIDIYEEMQQYERKAYLYEHEDKKEFRAEFEKFRNLTRRLKEGYDKEAPEVAAFLNECDERILYADAQLNELSMEYREVKKYAASIGMYQEKNNSVVDLMGIFNKENRYGLSGNWYYIASSQSNVTFQIMETPEVRNGKVVQGYSVTVISENGEVLEEIKNDSGNKEFAAQIRQLEEKYNMKDCKRFVDVGLAREYASANAGDIQKLENEAMDDTVSFTQAVNYCTEKKLCCVADTINSAYYAVSSRSGDNIKILILDRNNKMMETVTVPQIEKSTQEGYEKIIALQNKYGFSDKMRVFNSMEEAREYVDAKTVDKTDKELRHREEWRM